MVWKSTTQLGCALVTCAPNTLYQASVSVSALKSPSMRPLFFLLAVPKQLCHLRILQTRKLPGAIRHPSRTTCLREDLKVDSDGEEWSGYTRAISCVDRKFPSTHHRSVLYYNENGSFAILLLSSKHRKLGTRPTHALQRSIAS